MLTAGSTYLVEIQGVDPGTGYDRTNVTGTVDLGGATLSLVFSSFAAPEGGEYIIITNDGTDEIVNRFAGLEDVLLLPHLSPDNPTQDASPTMPVTETTCRLSSISQTTT